ncbi:Trk K+ transport system NAD-binding subunit [Ilumatobacter fluminis]|uniref:Trk K+ transport system NAD-binding subunit n=1 Tax=Ilumatobacter fluminis TaxID=467091 RepID=A0A4R7I471_9ACTN|nr:NAD-binding protein [Ilumatobacter fluminis]TDT18467.1 Trk K+ transport system NAD-binding subunit [Ilumatobacter fluminis]
MLKSLGVTIAQVTDRLRKNPDVARAGRDYESPEAAVQAAERKRRMRTVFWLVATFVGMVAIFSTMFHELMAREGRSYSWPTSVYWTLTTMTTLGFGDITFESDAGRIFSVVVLLAGSTFLLVMLPFVFIQFVFVPWMNERDRRRAPTTVPEQIRRHLILTEPGPVELALADRAEQAGVPYVILVDDLDLAGNIHDGGRRVMVGELDDPDTYRKARIDEAAMVVATRNDPTNTNIAFTVREIAPDVRILATANAPESVDILEIAGADHVLQLGEILGSAMAARALGIGGKSHVIGDFAGLRIAEAGVVGTAMEGRTLKELALRSRLGVGIIGVWDRGEFSIADPDTELVEPMILLLAATDDQLATFDDEYAVPTADEQHAVIIGGGRVGRAIGANFDAQGHSFTIIEKLADRERAGVPYVVGDAADRAVLERAGLDRATAILITTHDDDVNVYLTRYCRGLRPDVRIVSRSRLDRNVTTLYRAGADAVLSYAGTGSAAIWNQFRGDETLLIAQGLHVFRSPMPDALAGRSLADAHVFRTTGCNVVAVDHDGRIDANPDARAPLPAGGELILVGTDEAESDFATTYRR